MRYCWLSSFFHISTLNTWTVTSTGTIKSTIPFFEWFHNDLPSSVKYFVQTVTNFLLLSAEYTKNELFLTFWWPQCITPGGCMIKMTPFSYPLFKLSLLFVSPSVDIFDFYISRTSIFNSMWSPLYIMLWSVKYIPTYM